MANENEDIKKGADEHNEAPKHTSWLGNMIDKIQDLDTDFPLSGGDEDPRPARHHEPHHDEKKPENTAEGSENKKKPEHHQSFIGHIVEEIKHKIDHLDTDFPLSGGEEE